MENFHPSADTTGTTGSITTKSPPPSPSRPRRRFVRAIRITLGTLAVALVGTYAAVSWIAAGWLVAPDRKPLNSHHLDWLAYPGEHGIRITRSITSRKVPYLVCEPDPTAGLSRKGRILREQLAASGNPTPPFGSAVGTIVLIHGRGGRKEDFIPVAERFCAVGFRCLLPDLPGHGENPEGHLRLGRGALEHALAKDVLNSASAEFRFPATPAAIWGISLGGAYAIQAAAEDPDRWKGLIVVSSFDSLSPVLYRQGRQRFKNLGPFLTWGAEQAIWMRTGRSPRHVKPARMLKGIEIPVMVIHGAEDPVITEHQGRRLFDAVSHQQKRWISVAGARHGNVLSGENSVYAEMAGWYLYSIQLAHGNGGRPPSTMAKNFAIPSEHTPAASPAKSRSVVSSVHPRRPDAEARTNGA